MMKQWVGALAHTTKEWNSQPTLAADQNDPWMNPNLKRKRARRSIHQPKLPRPMAYQNNLQNNSVNKRKLEPSQMENSLYGFKVETRHRGKRYLVKKDPSVKTTGRTLADKDIAWMPQNQQNILKPRGYVSANAIVNERESLSYESNFKYPRFVPGSIGNRRFQNVYDRDTILPLSDIPQRCPSSISNRYTSNYASICATFSNRIAASISNNFPQHQQQTLVEDCDSTWTIDELEKGIRELSDFQKPDDCLVQNIDMNNRELNDGILQNLDPTRTETITVDCSIGTEINHSESNADDFHNYMQNFFTAKEMFSVNAVNQLDEVTHSSIQSEDIGSRLDKESDKEKNCVFNDDNKFFEADDDQVLIDNPTPWVMGDNVLNQDMVNKRGNIENDSTDDPEIINDANPSFVPESHSYYAADVLAKLWGISLDPL